MQNANERICSYTDLVVWQKAVELVTEIYKATSTFPREEMFGLTSQMRRSAVSVPSNIAEGQGRATKGEFIQFLATARGSLFELKTQFHIAGALGFLTPQRTEDLTLRADSIGQLLNGLLRSLGGTRHR